jgi:hypothetical protein
MIHTSFIHRTHAVETTMDLATLDRENDTSSFTTLRGNSVLLQAR